VKWWNWARISSCVPAHYHQPASVAELQQIVAYARDRKETIKVVGAGHSPNAIACTRGHMISLDKISRILEIHPDTGLVKCEGGCRLKTLNVEAMRHGLAISSLGAISEQSVAGAIATGTHGTGIEYGIIASKVVELELLTADGKIYRLAADDPSARMRRLFAFSLVHLGALGIVVTVTLQLERVFKLHEVRYSRSLDKVLASLPAAIHSAEHWRFWWFPHTNTCEVLEANRTALPAPRAESGPAAFAGRILKDQFFGYHLLELLLYLSRWFPSLVPLINRVYAWVLFRKRRERIDESFKVFNFECLFRQYVSEWAIPVERTVEAMHGLKRIIEANDFKAHFPVEVRFVKGDEIPLSMCSGRDTCFIGIIAYRPYLRDTPYLEYFDQFERLMKSLGGRPHWAKIYRCGNTDFEAMYGSAWDEFKALRQEVDPAGVFLNDHLKRMMNI
jgi:L-gulonolactone oxidase